MGGRGALLLTWMMVGYSNNTLYAPFSVLKRFQHRGAMAIGMVKSIVHAPDFGAVMNHHDVTLKKLDASYIEDQAKQVQHWDMDVVHIVRPAQLNDGAKDSIKEYSLADILSEHNVTKDENEKEGDDIDFDGLARYIDTALFYHIRFTSLE
jgi:hypothetical protein